MGIFLLPKKLSEAKKLAGIFCCYYLAQNKEWNFKNNLVCHTFISLFDVEFHLTNIFLWKVKLKVTDLHKFENILVKEIEQQHKSHIIKENPSS